MRNWCKFLTVILSLVATLSMAETCSPEFYSSGSSYSSNDSSEFKQEISSIIKVQSDIGQETSDNKSTNLAKTKLELFPSEPIQPELLLLQARATASIFNCLKQTNPTYYLKIIQLPPVVANNNYLLNDSINIVTPWFVHHNQSSSSRVSGWKDGNSLYASQITYHI